MISLSLCTLLTFASHIDFVPLAAITNWPCVILGIFIKLFHFPCDISHPWKKLVNHFSMIIKIHLIHPRHCGISDEIRAFSVSVSVEAGVALCWAALHFSCSPKRIMNINVFNYSYLPGILWYFYKYIPWLVLMVIIPYFPTSWCFAAVCFPLALKVYMHMFSRIFDHWTFHRILLEKFLLPKWIASPY